MGTVELFDPLSVDGADGWHRIGSPGGYETWHFDAEQDDGRLRIVVDFHHGFVFDPEYVRRYYAYLAKPTRNMPPVPSEYPCVHAAVYEHNKLLAGATTRYSQSAFEARGSDVRIGPNRVNILPLSLVREVRNSEETTLTLTPDRVGAFSLSLSTGRGNETLSADMVFRSRHFDEPAQKQFPSGLALGSQHWWILGAATWEASGEIRVGNRKLSLNGLGYHDHYFGAAPLGVKLGRWMRGRILGPRGTLAFELAVDDALLEQEICVLAADESGVRELAVANASTTWDRRTRWGLVYPSSMTLAPNLLLRNPRVVDSSAWALRAVFDAYVDGEQAQAFCEIVYPGRLRKRLAAWWIGRSIGNARAD